MHLCLLKVSLGPLGCVDGSSRNKSSARRMKAPEAISIQSTHPDPKGFHSQHPAPGLDSLFKKYPQATESSLPGSMEGAWWAKSTWEFTFPNGQSLNSDLSCGGVELQMFYLSASDGTTIRCDLGTAQNSLVEWAKVIHLGLCLMRHLCLPSFSSRSYFPTPLTIFPGNSSL